MTSQRLQFGQGFWVWWVALILDVDGLIREAASSEPVKIAA